MRHPKLVPPLPQDLQNRSFKGQDCQGWDFSGRDIRGCDFRQSNLRDADFTGVHAGRTQQQIKREKIGIPIGLVLGLILPLILMTAYRSPGVLSRESIDAATKLAILTFSIGITLMFAAIGVFQSLRLRGGLIAMGSIAYIGCAIGYMFKFMYHPSMNNLWINGAITISGVALISIFSVRSYRHSIKQLHDAIGTDFQGANLRGANFTNAMLKNCAFKDADLSQTNWTNVETSRCDRDVTKLA